MNLDYRITAVVAMIFLCFSTLFTKLAMKGGLSPRHTFIIFAGIALVVTCLVDVCQGEKFWKALNLSAGTMFACAGALLGVVALLLYYGTLGRGPMSTVVPIWSLQAVGVGTLGIIFLKENLTDAKIAAMFLAIMAVWLITRPS